VDSVFVQRTRTLDDALRPYAFPTVSGRDLGTTRGEFRSDKSMLIPYDSMGRLLPLEDLGALRVYLSEPAVHAKLNSRTCVAHKPWYAFHDSMPLPDILKPKLLCKDITSEPYFWIDRGGSIVPRHSVYYVVPRDPAVLEKLQAYLNSAEATAWLRANCQRAANGFLRLQSSVLKRLPVPIEFATFAQKERSTPLQLIA
jgi:adenine-specific DNA-methyltransferase